MALLPSAQPLYPSVQGWPIIIVEQIYLSDGRQFTAVLNENTAVLNENIGKICVYTETNQRAQDAKITELSQQISSLQATVNTQQQEIERQKREIAGQHSRIASILQGTGQLARLMSDQAESFVALRRLILAQTSSVSSTQPVYTRTSSNNRAVARPNSLVTTSTSPSSSVLSLGIQKPPTSSSSHSNGSLAQSGLVTTGTSPSSSTQKPAASLRGGLLRSTAPTFVPQKQSTIR